MPAIGLSRYYRRPTAATPGFAGPVGEEEEQSSLERIIAALMERLEGGGQAPEPPASPTFGDMPPELQRQAKMRGLARFAESIGGAERGYLGYALAAGVGAEQDERSGALARWAEQRRLEEERGRSREREDLADIVDRFRLGVEVEGYETGKRRDRALDESLEGMYEKIAEQAGADSPYTAQAAAALRARDASALQKIHDRLQTDEWFRAQGVDPRHPGAEEVLTEQELKARQLSQYDPAGRGAAAGGRPYRLERVSINGREYVFDPNDGTYTEASEVPAAEANLGSLEKVALEMTLSQQRNHDVVISGEFDFSTQLDANLKLLRSKVGGGRPEPADPDRVRRQRREESFGMPPASPRRRRGPAAETNPQIRSPAAAPTGATGASGRDAEIQTVVPEVRTSSRALANVMDRIKRERPHLLKNQDFLADLARARGADKTDDDLAQELEAGLFGP